MRTKHGQYDQQRHLPDNRMQAVGSGTDVWLQQEVLSRIGQDQGQALLEQARVHKAHRYQWLLEQMTTLGHGDLTEQYQQRKREDEALRRYRDKEHRLRQLEELIKTNPPNRSFLEKEQAKCQRYLAQRSDLKEKADESQKPL
jgi:hypothetical protein